MEFATKNRLPTMLPYRELVEGGGLMSYGPSYEHMHRRAAIYVDKILKGAKPGDLPVEQPTKFGLRVNVSRQGDRRHDPRSIPASRRPSN